MEIRIEVTTLLGLDDHPAEIAGWGPVNADVARRLVRDQTAAEWRYALTGEDGRLLLEGITRRRPAGFPSRAASPARGGIVELQVELATLRRLTVRPARLGGWAEVIADLLRQADRHTGAVDDRRRPDQGGRSPGRPLRRRTQIRDRTCIHPGCRAPASGADGDHTDDWAHGGATTEDNIGALCRHDHRLKHQGGWTLTQTAPGHFIWRSRLGRRYLVRPPLIIQPLPRPVPRDPSPRGRLDQDADPSGYEDPRIWCGPAAAPREPNSRPPPPVAEAPPF